VVDIGFFVFFQEVHVLRDASDGLSTAVLGSVVGRREPFEWWTGCEEREERWGEFVCHLGDGRSLRAFDGDGG